MKKQYPIEDWQSVRFGDIAIQVSERANPRPGDEKEYVGLEHLDSGSLIVKRWGGDVVLKGQKLVMKKGDILFAKRNAYLKRVALAPFDGLFSAHGMVLRPTGNMILPEFLPHFMQSEQFMNRAIAISEGSLSPTIKWKTLAEQKFVIPPAEVQKKIVEVGSQLNNEIELNESAELSVKKLHSAIAKELILGGNDFSSLFGKQDTIIPQGWKLCTLGDVLTRVQYGTSDAVHVTGDVPVLRMMNIEDGCITAKDLKFSKLSINQLESIKLEVGDILFNRTNSMEWVGKTGLFSLPGDYVFASYMLRLNVNRSIVTPEFVNRFLNLPLIQYRLKALATPGVSQANINPTSLKSIPFLLPPLDEVHKADEVLEQVESSLYSLRNCRSETQTLQMTARELMLEG